MDVGFRADHGEIASGARCVVEAVFEQLSVREHMLKVNIPYSTSSVAIKYVDSQNLDYGEKKGVKVIHPKWVNWTRNLLSDIQRELMRESSK